MRPGPLLPTELTLHRALSIARWCSWLWTVGVVVTGGDDLRSPGVAWAAVAAAGVVAAVGTAGVRTSGRSWVHGGAFAIVQAVVAIGLVVVDGIAFAEGHVFATSQNMAAAAPTTAAIALGIAFGAAAGVVGGALLGASRVLGALANGVDEMTGPRWGSILASVVFVGLWGGVAGWLVGTLRSVETEVIARRERDNVAQNLHDTVLQALAVIARRTEDPELAALARRTDGEVRRSLYGPLTTEHHALTAAVHAAADRVAMTFDIELVVNVVDDDPPVTDDRVGVLAGAIGEAVTNSAKHASSTGAPAEVVVFVEVDDSGHLFASVRDDGPGFDVAAATEGRGLTSSIRAPIESAGGCVEIGSNPDAGTEVRMWLP